MTEETSLQKTSFRMIGILLAIALVVSIPAALFAHSSLKVLLSPDVLSQVLSDLLLADGGWRDQFIAGVYPTMFPEREQQTHWFENLGLEERDEVATVLFPVDWIEDQLQGVVSSYISWVDSNASSQELVIQGVPLMPYLEDDASRTLVEIAVNSWPPCTTPQSQIIEQALRQDRLSGIPLCKPSGDLSSDYVNTLDTWLQSQILQLEPEVSTFLDRNKSIILEEISQSRPNIISFLVFLRRVRLIPLFILGMLMTLIIRSFRDLGHWWGLVIVLGSGLAMIVVLLGYLFGPGIVQKWISSSGDRQGVVNEALWSLIRPIFNRTFMLSAFFVLIGVGMYMLPKLLEKRITVPEPIEPIIDEDDHQAQPSDPPPIKPFNPGEEPDSSSKETPSGIFG
jgi:hypothetical protein